MLKHKFLTISITLMSAALLTAQEQQQEKGLYIKGNALLAPIGVLNVGLEKQISKKYTLQGDVFISPWKSFAGHEFQYYSLSFEGRYYFNEAFSKWYIGANIAGSAFVLQKWNYWSNSPYINDKNEVFVSSNLYQKGVSFILGVTGGYQFKVSDRWNIDVYATVGTSQDFYKGYDRNTGQRYESAKKFNKSGEFLPYRGGVMISYKLK
ncbi:DUF3575 domain-containing protein [Chryseobacterium oranimense]|uniref:DUF3575 domain-containing protein n=1 Tax=Chryseobacterium oranimense TaxID=421058 RepID=UPI002236BBF7|nr:DUF3575 domain-containing protein [Chryseobacterium oranimense]